MKQLILIRGLPGSGKSTLAKTLRDHYRITDFASHFEADMFFEDEDGKYNFDHRMIKDAHKWCQDCTDQRLRQDHVVIVSNTFTTLRELEPYFQIAKDHGIVPLVYLAQNRFPNVHDVPADVLQRMRVRFEYNVEPLFEKYE